MMTTTSKNGALGLLSGGLDSQLAVRLLQRQGITVRTIVFNNPFYDISAAVKAAAALEVPLRIYDFTDAILALIKNPPHGFGKCMNPCIDCHALMLRRAGDLLAEEGCRFLFTGEVLNERPMSQTRRALQTVAADSAYADLVLRPLSALSLPPVKPEREGWVDRQQLLNLNGRRRTTQFALAREFGLQSYPSPAGGCLLADVSLGRRLATFYREQAQFTVNDIRLHLVGRQFRLPGGGWLAMGRNDVENQRIENLAQPGEVRLATVDRPGPVALLRFATDPADRLAAAGLIARYAKKGPPWPAEVVVEISDANEMAEQVNVSPLTEKVFEGWRR